jgi:hypothetical protein
VIGEAVFAPKAGRNDEEAGYILTFVINLATMESRLVNNRWRGFFGHTRGNGKAASAFQADCTAIGAQ